MFHGGGLRERERERQRQRQTHRERESRVRVYPKLALGQPNSKETNFQKKKFHDKRQ